MLHQDKIRQTVLAQIPVNVNNESVYLCTCFQITIINSEKRTINILFQVKANAIFCSKQDKVHSIIDTKK